MIELRHLQLVVLSILKDVDTLCKKHNIEYYLAYGSALGAMRHKGFIPWDDDIDIMLDAINYCKFIEVAKNELPNSKYYVQEGLVDWPMPVSKIRLKGTVYSELDMSEIENQNGIFIDVFKLNNVSQKPIVAKWQYFCAKYYLSYALSARSYNSASFKKKVLMWLASPLKLKPLRTLVLGQVEQYNAGDTGIYGCFYTPYRYHNSVVPSKYVGKPTYVDFEDTKMPVPQNWDKYLSYIYGDYMTPPPPEKQKGPHLTNIDFGKY